MIELSLYFLAWLSFAVLHSFLASSWTKRKFFPLFIGGYRLLYNLFAILHLGCVFILGLFLFQNPKIFHFPLFFEGIKVVFLLMGIILLIFALRQYDLGLFSGLKQWRQARKGQPVDETETLRLNGLNQWVRHPLYSACFMIVWARIENEFDLYSAIFASFYLILGSRFEERALIRQYGDAYKSYQAKVPAFIPYKGRQPL